MNIKQLSKIAKGRGGKVLSTSNNKVKFECFHGHVFEAAPSSIAGRGSWCPKCKAYHRTEEICRVYFEHIFNSKFLKRRPLWLVNKHGNRLELDGYSAEHMVAFEYNGPQHYKKTSWYPNDESVRVSKYHEGIKVSKCKKRGVRLVIVTYRTKVDGFLGEIKRQLELLGVNTDNLTWSRPSLKKVYTNEIYIQRLKSALHLKGFKLLDTEYRGGSSKYTASCNTCGRKRKTSPHSLLRNSCKSCSGKEKKTIDDAIKLARSRGGECLSKRYINNTSPLKWRCVCGHVWKASYSSVTHGNWCPSCGHTKKQISVKASWAKRRVDDNVRKLREINALAENSGFTLLSKTYVDCDSPMVFLCKNGHKWKIGTRSFKRAIRSGRGCTYCGPNARKATRLR